MEIAKKAGKSTKWKQKCNKCKTSNECDFIRETTYLHFAFALAIKTKRNILAF